TRSRSGSQRKSRRTSDCAGRLPSASAVRRQAKVTAELERIGSTWRCVAQQFARCKLPCVDRSLRQYADLASTHLRTGKCNVMESKCHLPHSKSAPTAFSSEIFTAEISIEFVMR